MVYSFECKKGKILGPSFLYARGNFHSLLYHLKRGNLQQYKSVYKKENFSKCFCFCFCVFFFGRQRAQFQIHLTNVGKKLKLTWKQLFKNNFLFVIVFFLLFCNRIQMLEIYLNECWYSPTMVSFWWVGPMQTSVGIVEISLNCKIKYFPNTLHISIKYCK